MDEPRLRALAQAFYERSSLLSHDRESGLRHYLDFARKVAEADCTTFRLIRDMAQTHYERLSPRDKMVGAGRALKNVAEVADSAMRVE
jgi:hypothetical protein